MTRFESTKFWQINLQHCKSAMSNLAKQFANSSSEGTIALVQEPYLIKSGRVASMGRGHEVLSMSNCRPRAAIIAKNSELCFRPSLFCRDTAVANGTVSGITNLLVEMDTKAMPVATKGQTHTKDHGV